MLLSKLKDFSGNTSIHGIGRIGESTFILRKTFWICICLASFSMCLYQIYRLVIQYESESINTKLSTRYTSLDFPSVSFCNMNPLSYARIKTAPQFYQIINETANAMNVDISAFASEIQAMMSQDSMYFNKTGPNPTQDVRTAFQQRMGWEADQTIYDLSDPPELFLVECSYQGRECNRTTEIQRIRDDYFGSCYTFTPTVQRINLPGPGFGLILVFDVNQPDYIPFVGMFAGVRLAVHGSKFTPSLQGNGFSVATKFQTDVSLRQKRINRYPGSDNSLCDNSNRFEGILACFESCIGDLITVKCECLFSSQYRKDSVQTICSSDTDVMCVNEVVAIAANNPTDFCDCRPPCSEITYENDIFMTSYPSRNYEMVLKQLLNKTSENMESFRESLVSVNIYFGSFVEDIIDEELAYTTENFVSDIGGQLGLWGGLSVLSMVEVIELIIILIHVCCSPVKTEIQG